MSDQRMNASDQGSQPDSGSDPRDQVTVDGQGASRGKPGKTAQPESHIDVTEAAHNKGKGQKKDKD
jgi:hypothetical protein